MIFEEDKDKNTISSKLKTGFAVFVVFVLMAAVAVVFLGIDLSQEQSLSSQTPKSIEEEEQPIIIIENPETLKSQEEKEQQQESIYLAEMRCAQLQNFVSLFEKGWGRAVAEYNSRCEIDK